MHECTILGEVPAADGEHPSPCRAPRMRCWGGFGVFYDAHGASRFGEHLHPELQVFVPLARGAFEASWRTPADRRKRKRIGGGGVCVVPPAQAHSTHWDGEAEVLSFYMDRTHLSRVADEATGTDAFEIAGGYGVEDPLVRQLALGMRVELRQGASPGRLYAESLANVLAVHLLRRYSALGEGAVREYGGGLSQPRLRRATDYVEENLARNLALSELAEAVGLSPYHFSRSFKRSTGLSPHGYLVERRVERAKLLLAATDLPVSEVARDLGFSNPGHLTRHFRRLVGVAPTEYRRNSKNV